MRVLQAMAGAPHGGAEAFFERLVPALARAGLTQRVLIRRNAGRAQRLRKAGIDPVELSFGSMLDLSTRRAFQREVRRFRPDIVLTWMSRATRFCPRDGFVHIARLGGYYDVKHYRHCDHLVGNTRDIVKYLTESGWPAERAHYLPNFVDSQPLAALPRAMFSTPDGVPLALALGRLHENKAFDILIAALRDVPRLWLWIAGEGPEKASLEAQAASLGVGERLRFIGWREDVPALLAAADMLVCPSRHEPLGNVVIEGWAHHRPVIAAASAGPLALIRDGDNGLIVPIDDAVSLAKAIERIIDDRGLATHLVDGGWRAFDAEFTEAAVVRQYLDFFSRVIH
ncbi:MAG: glycosyltransferase [Alphaproteobacteria bacterium]